MLLCGMVLVQGKKLFERLSRLFFCNLQYHFVGMDGVVVSISRHYPVRFKGGNRSWPARGSAPAL